MNGAFPPASSETLYSQSASYDPSTRDINVLFERRRRHPVQHLRNICRPREANFLHNLVLTKLPPDFRDVFVGCDNVDYPFWDACARCELYDNLM